MDMEGVQVVPATREHNEAMREIYNDEVRRSLATMDIEPRTVLEQGQWFAEHHERWPILVALLDGEVVGYGALSPYHPHPGYRHTAEDSVYVAETFRGKGVGKLLLHHLLLAAQERGFHTVVARLVADDDPARALHERFDFRRVSYEYQVARKFDQWLDMAVMQVMITPQQANGVHEGSATGGPESSSLPQ
jgi:L-amino acid N-acyltransferase